MARTSKYIEFIKDRSDRAYIKANSIVTDNNESLQDVLNSQKLYMMSGSKVCNPGGANSVVVHTWSEIQNLFKTYYGFTPSRQDVLGVVFTNGDGNANGVHLNGATWLGTTLYATLNSASSNNLRVNYAYFYNY